MEEKNIENKVEETEAAACETAPEAEVETEVEIEVPTAEITDNKFAVVLNKVKDGAVSVFGAVMSKFKADPKGFGIKVGAIFLAAVLVVVGLCVGIGAATNNYKTPIKTIEKFANTKKYFDYTDRQLALLNGFCEDEMKELIKLMMSSEDYDDDAIEDAKDEFKDNIDDLKDKYGKNYKYTYKVIDKEKLDKDELKVYRDKLRDSADSIKDQIDETEDFDSDDWEDLADDMGFDGNKSKAKKYYSIMKDVRKVYKSAKVTAGYTLTVEITLTGSELDEPEVNELEYTVIKVNGRWILSSAVN